VKLQTEELQIHAEELSNLRNELDEEKSLRGKLEFQLKHGGPLKYV